MAESRLEIARYDDLERKAAALLPNLAQAAFGPVTFSAGNYPTRVTEEAALGRYIDTMHENAAGEFFGGRFTLSPDEADLIAAIGDTVAGLSRERFGRAVRPWLAPLDAVGMFRIVAAFAQRLGRKQARVLEIGPGSGYLGALLNRAGFRTVSMDNTQAFYLWQNRFYGALAGSGLAEMAEGGPPAADAAMIHLPWWSFAALHHQPALPVDFVVCDHALGEISLNALRYILRQAHRMLTAGAEPGLFLFRYSGARHVSSDRQIFAEFERAGFQTVFKRSFYALAPVGSPLDPLAISAEDTVSRSRSRRIVLKLGRDRLRGRFPELLALDSGAPPWNPSGRAGSVTADQAVPVRPEEAPADYDFVAATGIRIPGNR